MRRTLLSLLVLSAFAAPAPAQQPAEPEPSEEEYREILEVDWNGWKVRSEGYLEEAELRFYRDGKLVHREREESAHHWILFPPRDLNGDGIDDLHAWIWSGGAHCCTTHYVFLGTADGKVSSPGPEWRLDQGHGEAAQFAAVDGYPRPVLAVQDSSSAYVSGSFAGTPVLPYFVEAGPGGLRLAAPLMRSAQPGHGPALLGEGPAPLAAFARTHFHGDAIAPPAERLRAIRAALAAATGEHGISRLLPEAERHIKLHCVYDATCDIPALAAEAGGGRLPADWVKELDESWRGSQLYRLKQAADAGQAAQAAPLTLPDGYRLVWADEFSKPGLPDPARWNYDTAFNRRGWHNQEKQYYSARRSENSRVEDGRLIVEARHEPERAKSLPDWGGQAYTSARLVTRGKASWTYGFFEVRAKLPCGLGTWPAIWTLADRQPMKWPDDGEIDIMEHVGHDPGVVHQSVHTEAFNHVKGTHKTAKRPVPDACGAFHTYQLHWTPERIVMGMDGRTLFTFEKGEGGRAEWPFDGPQYLILNVAVGGTWGGSKGIDDAAFPERMEVDYVRVWQDARP